MAPDDVEVGQTVAVIKHLCGSRRCHLDFPGRPYEVAALSLPFAILRDCCTGEMAPIDLRSWELGRVHGSYVAAYKAMVAPRECQKPESSCAGHERCVRCGERMQQRLVKRKWRWHCEQCKVDGEVVAK